MSDGDGWTPAFEGQRPPFRQGNTAALRTGVHSERAVTPLAQEIERRFRAAPDTPGWALEPKFQHEVSNWAFSEAVLELARQELDRIGIVLGKEEVTTVAEESEIGKGGRGSRRSRQARSTSALDEYHRAASRAAAARKALGISPAGFSSIAAAVGYAFRQQEDAIAQLGADGRALMRKHNPALAARLDAQDAVALPPAGPADC